MSTIHWRLMRQAGMSGAFNMALDQALLESVAGGGSAPVLRLYRWRPAAVTLGYAQRGSRVVNLNACRELGLDVVRRCSGGRAVLHDREMTYAVIAPEPSEWFPGGVVASYRVIAAVLRETLAVLGLESELALGRRPGADADADADADDARASACFTAPATTELVHAGCKLTGGAQKRQKGAFLQHGSVPVDLDPARLFRALDTRGRLTAADGGALLARSVGWLNRWLPEPRSVTEVEDCFLDFFARRLDLNLKPDTPTAAEMARAHDLVARQYGNPGWNLAGIAG